MAQLKKWKMRICVGDKLFEVIAQNEATASHNLVMSGFIRGTDGSCCKYIEEVPEDTANSIKEVQRHPQSMSMFE